MGTAARTLALLILLVSPALAGADEEVARALEQLSSPYLEARRRAARELAGRGAEGSARLKAKYSEADYRTKILILDAFAATRPREGLSLVYEDLATPDRGVVLTQRRLVSAVYALPRNLVARQIAERLGPEEWRLEEHLGALPGPGPSPRAALAGIVESERAWLSTLAKPLAALVEDVDAMRRAFRARRTEGGPLSARRAAQMERRLLRHDVERAFLAVLEAGGLSGHYDGMYATVEEVLALPKGEEGFDVLFAIARGEPPTEGGVPDSRRKHYEFLEPTVPFLAVNFRRRAVVCVGDVGDVIEADVLARYFRSFLTEHRIQIRDDEAGEDRVEVTKSLDLKDVRSERALLCLEVAHACSALGVDAPLEMVVAELSARLARRPFSSEHRRSLAAAYARLGRLEEAVVEYRTCLRFDTSREGIVRYNLACALSRMGRVGMALRELMLSVDEGYAKFLPSEAVWMDRDGDLEAVRKTEGYKKLREALLDR